MFEKPIASRPYSNHADDSHLSVVLHKNFKGEYVTHVYNSQSNGYVHGHYFGKDLDSLDKAMVDFKNR
jgi:hypothetical protein